MLSERNEESNCRPLVEFACFCVFCGSQALSRPRAFTAPIYGAFCLKMLQFQPSLTIVTPQETWTPPNTGTQEFLDKRSSKSPPNLLSQSTTNTQTSPIAKETSPQKQPSPSNILHKTPPLPSPPATVEHKFEEEEEETEEEEKKKVTFPRSSPIQTLSNIILWDTVFASWLSLPLLPIFSDDDHSYLPSQYSHSNIWQTHTFFLYFAFATPFYDLQKKAPLPLSLSF